MGIEVWEVWEGDEGVYSCQSRKGQMMTKDESDLLELSNWYKAERDQALRVAERQQEVASIGVRKLAVAIMRAHDLEEAFGDAVGSALAEREKELKQLWEDNAALETLLQQNGQMIGQLKSTIRELETSHGRMGVYHAE